VGDGVDGGAASGGVEDDTGRGQDGGLDAGDFGEGGHRGLSGQGAAGLDVPGGQGGAQPVRWQRNAALGGGGSWEVPVDLGPGRAFSALESPEGPCLVMRSIGPVGVMARGPA